MNSGVGPRIFILFIFLKEGAPRINYIDKTNDLPEQTIHLIPPLWDPCIFKVVVYPRLADGVKCWVHWTAVGANC